jgi:tetratricopeptide (TPR) repeat protein
LQHKEKGYLPDFTAAVEGDAPVLESDLPLVRVRFMDSSPKIVSSRAKVQWDFGDGQTAETLDVNHVYLRPGLYTVKLTVQNSAQTLRISNRFHVHRALVLEGKKPDQLADYLRILDRYEVLKLDPAAIVQLLRVYEQLNRLDRAGQAGKAALLAAWKEPDEEALVELARLVGPLLRDRLGDPGGAAAAWQGAASLLRQGRLKADCELEAADIFINDVLQHAPAEGLLKAAATRGGQNDHSPQGLRLQRLWGDWYARANQRSEARAAYARAAAGQGGGKSIVEQNAWRGAFSRSTEAFLRDKEWNRALEELRRWQEQFPGDKVEGYLPLLQARYWEARGQYAQAIAVANDLCNLNPDSPYADRLAFLAAECDEKQGRRDRAQAAFKSFLTDYPGSPLVGEVRKKLAQLSLPPDKVTKKPKPTQPPQPPDKVKIPSRPPRKP